MPAPRKYPDEVRERAVRLVQEARRKSGQQRGPLTQVARQLDINPETLRKWVRGAEADEGLQPGVAPVAERQRVAELERENRELRRANEILKAASAFFARELDPRLPR